MPLILETLHSVCSGRIAELLARHPLQPVVFEGGGQPPPRIEVIREILDWLDRYHGPVGRRCSVTAVTDLVSFLI